MLELGVPDGEGLAERSFSQNAIAALEILFHRRHMERTANPGILPPLWTLFLLASMSGEKHSTSASIPIHRSTFFARYEAGYAL